MTPDADRRRTRGSSQPVSPSASHPLSPPLSQRESQRAARQAVALLGLVWVAALVLAPIVGSSKLDLGQLFEPSSTAAVIVWQLRLPRVLLGLLAGGALAISGLSFQTLFRNPLTEPYTLGLSAGAALGAVFALQFESWFGWEGFPWVALASFLGAFGVGVVVLGLAARRSGIRTTTLLLAGIAISLTCSALILFLQYLADFTQTFRMVRWMMGGLAVVGYRDVLWLLPWVVLGSAVLMRSRWELNLLLTGEELAASRGVDVGRTRWLVVGAVSVMVAALVSVTGPIGFVGLVVPHVLRRWVGPDHLYLLPAAFLGGGAFLALADLAARTVMAPAELPVGVLTALLGGPFFLWLIVRRAA